MNTTGSDQTALKVLSAPRKATTVHEPLVLEESTLPTIEHPGVEPDATIDKVIGAEPEPPRVVISKVAVRVSFT